jgi:hypothetical protein
MSLTMSDLLRDPWFLIPALGIVILALIEVIKGGLELGRARSRDSK